MKSERLKILKAETSSDMETLDRLEAKYRAAKDKLKRIEPDELDYAALAYTIVNLYTLMENYFVRVARIFENEVERGRWHKDLVRRMALDIEGVRPALLGPDDVAPIDELRAFRHVFRHIYQADLDIEKLKIVDSRTPAALAAFRSAHKRFSSALDLLLRAIEEGG